MTPLSAAYQAQFGTTEQSDPAPRARALRVLICGAVDDGKSTLIGRLVVEAGGLTDDQHLALVEASHRHGTVGATIDYSLVTDGLEAEREQNITIDVAYRYLAARLRDIIIVDTPGHEQYTANMATGASHCDVAVILVDAVRGLRPQTFRHAAICSLLGLREIVLAVNKLDSLAYDQAAFEAVVSGFVSVASHLQLNVIAIPIAARLGVNITARSAETPWYQGDALLPHLEAIAVTPDQSAAGLRLPVQGIARTPDGKRLYMGTIVSGEMARGQMVRVALSGAEATVSDLINRGRPALQAGTGDAVAFTLHPDLDLGRGGMITARSDGPLCTDLFAAFVIWFGQQPLFAGRDYELRSATAISPVTVTTIRGKLDVLTGVQVSATRIERDEIAICHLATPTRMALDPYAHCPPTGRFILVDRVTGDTVAAGLVRHPLDRGSNLSRQALTVDRQARETLLGQKGFVIWFTGLSGAGKSTIADALERRLHAEGKLTVLLDGDNLRLGLNRDLGFTEEDRVENLRRVAEVAKLMLDAGLIVLCCFISPFARDRTMVRERLSDGPFFEVHVDASIETCERRDPKGLYYKARRGEIRNFTGIDSAYEVPEHPDLVLDSDKCSVDELVERIVGWLARQDMLA